MQKSFRDLSNFKKRYQKKVVQSPCSPCSQFSLISDNYFYSVHRYFVILSTDFVILLFNFMILLYTETDKFAPILFK